MDCEPAFDYNRNPASWEYSAAGYGEAVARAKRTRMVPDASVDDEPADRSGRAAGAGADQVEGG